MIVVVIVCAFRSL